MIFRRNSLRVLALSIICASAGTAEAQKDWEHTIGANAAQSREHWAELTEGEDLARGKKVFFSPAPNYPLTTDKNDPYDLTDGTLSARADDRVWFQKDAVGWSLGAGTTSGSLMMIDLGAEQPIGQIAIRVLGGREQGTLELPAKAEFLASVDGKQYYSLQKMVKFNPAERKQADGITGFYYPEEGKAYMVPLVSRIPVRARYVALRITPISSLFVDQISVLKAAPVDRLNDLKSLPQAEVYTDGLVITPRHRPFVVTTNIATPNWLTVLDNTGLDPTKEKLGFRLELPQGLQLLPNRSPEFREVTSTDAGTRAYEFIYNGKLINGSFGPLWIEKNGSVPARPIVKFTGLVQGNDSHLIESPLQLVEIPEVAPINGLDVSLAWMGDTTEQEWPNFLRDFRKMGFSYVSTFPRYFSKDKNGQWNAYSQKNLDFLQQARQAGYKILYNESPFHMMWDTIQADLKAGRLEDAEASQIFTQVDGNRGKHLNILYRGKYFKNEIKRVAELAALVQPDHIYHDIEFWDGPVSESKTDPRVIDAWKASRKEWTDFVTDIGAEVLKELNAAARLAVPQKKIIIGTYNSDPKNNIYNSIFRFDKIYPDIVDIAQPSLYVQGRSQLVSERIRFDYDAMQKKDIIPWLSAGTYGEFDPKFIEPMILESILNGALGVTYYWFGDFDPMDFYYHSKALFSLAQYETLLKNGKPTAYEADNSDLHYRAFTSDKEALVLVENFSGTSNTKVNLKSPVSSSKKIFVDNKFLTLNNDTVSIDVPPNEFRLIYFGK